MEITKQWIVDGYKMLVQLEDKSYMIGSTTNQYGFNRISTEKALELINGEIRCERCDSECEQITGEGAEQPYKGFDSNIPLLRCLKCHHEFDPF